MKKIILFVTSLFVMNANATSITAHWNFNDGLLDVTATPISTTGSNVGITSGRFARALTFDGSTSSVRVADNEALDFEAGNFALSLWILPRLMTGQASIINKRGTGANGTFSGFSLGITESGGKFSITALVDNGQGDFIACEGCGDTYDFFTWHHISLVYSTDKLSVYVNGQLDSEVTGSNIGNIDNNLPMAFGANLIDAGAEGPSSEHYDGILDEVKIFSDALQENDVAAIFNSDNETDFSTRLGAFTQQDPSGVTFVRNTTYRAPSDGFVVVFQSGGACNRNHTDILVGDAADNLNNLAGRIPDYSSVTVPVARGDFWFVNHATRVSSCRPTISFRPLF